MPSEVVEATKGPHIRQGLAGFNALPDQAAVIELMACCGSRHWATAVAGHRPYVSHLGLATVAGELVEGLDWVDVLEALSAHPRIGQRAAGTDREARWSRQEQAAAADEVTDEVAVALYEANVAYEKKFGFVFLICATGRTAVEVLTELNRRIVADPAAERDTVRRELAKITQLRLARLLDA